MAAPPKVGCRCGNSLKYAAGISHLSRGCQQNFGNGKGWQKKAGCHFLRAGAGRRQVATQLQITLDEGNSFRYALGQLQLSCNCRAAPKGPGSPPPGRMDVVLSFSLVGPFLFRFLCFFLNRSCAKRASCFTPSSREGPRRHRRALARRSRNRARGSTRRDIPRN